MLYYVFFLESYEKWNKTVGEIYLRCETNYMSQTV